MNRNDRKGSVKDAKALCTWRCWRNHEKLLMKTVIIEDEPLIARDLQKLLKQVAPEAEILATLNSLATATAWFAVNPEPELLLMDIQLSDGVSFDLFHSISISCPVIFTTAYNEYAIRAFKVNSIDYLLKPIDVTDLQAAVDKFHRLRAQPVDFRQHLAALLKELTPAGEKLKYRERFMAHFKNTLMPVPVDRVGYFVKDELIYLVTHDNQRLVTDYDTMEEIEHEVDPAIFFRANRQYILPLNTIAHFKTHYNGKLIVKLLPPLNAEVEVSREKAAEFKKWLSR